jgi:1-acyl-sn-glycerol-3-phosphate acyltransferase
MKRAPIRSTVFNISFLVVTAVLSILYVPGLLLPRRFFVKLVRFWLRVVTFLEYGLLNLRYEVRGRENIPASGPYIIASKHQSEYETFKAHLLFDDPAIVLKKELLRIPFFGAYLRKAGVLAIDRSTPERALRSIQSGALEIKKQGRPLLIFPQGTRVSPDQGIDVKPYKPGIARVQDVTQLPILPVALNSGIFWPKNSWVKSSGTVIFEILPPIPPGHSRANLMSTLQDLIETRSSSLVAEARSHNAILQKSPIRTGIKIILYLLLICAAYAAWWSMAARWINESYTNLSPLRPSQLSTKTLDINAFPMMHAVSAEEIFITGDGIISLSEVSAKGWPLPGVSTQIQTGRISVTHTGWRDALVFDHFYGRIVPGINTITITESILAHGDFRAEIKGTVKQNADIPQLDLNVRFQNYAGFIKTLIENGILEERPAQFMIAAFNALADADGFVTIPITQNGRTLYAGPFAIAKLPSRNVITERSFPLAPADPQAPSR